VEGLTVVPNVSLSNPTDARMPRTWIALLRGRVRASLAATTGVETPSDVAKYLLAGADVVMTASALLRHGPKQAAVLLDGLAEWMARHGFQAVDEVRGMLSVPPDSNEDEYERASYVSAMRAANATAYRPW
jgi:dihydroorotate dehydrogenase (fumarate)